ncbi:MAG: O-antigen ligase family protein [Bacteroidales bacterium]|nr:O-antigen ligase family protein [Bacteroidales bacterium]
MRDKFNRYDLILVTMATLLVFGELGNGLQAVRLFALALSPFLFVEVLRRPLFSVYYYRYECVLMAFWFAFAIAFLYKAEELSESIKHVIYLICHMLIFFEIIWSAIKSKDPQRSLTLGWTLMLVMTFPVAFYEFVNDFHLPTSVQDTGEVLRINGVEIERRFASVTFGNLNSYNTVLCWCLPFLFCSILYPKRGMEMFLSIVFLFVTIFIVAANSSRGAFLCFGTVLVIFLYCYLHIGRHRFLLLSVLILLFGVFLYYVYEIFFIILERFSTTGFDDDGRIENIVKGVDAFLNSGMIGIGIGNYAVIMGRDYHVAFTAPHNLLLEILVLFGVFVFVGVVGMFVRLFCFAYQGTRYNWYMFLLFFTCLVFAGIVDSNYVMKPATWAFIASFYVFVDQRFNRGINEG